jgi:Ca2+/Na+ antiporter
MNFEQIKACWAEENQQDMYEINLDHLEKVVANKKAGAERFTNLAENVILFVNLPVGLGLLALGILKGKQEVFPMVIVALMLGMAVYVMFSRRARLQAQRNFSNNLEDGLAQAISDTRYRVRLSQFGLWYIILIAFMSVGAFVEMGNLPWWSYLILAGFFILTYLAGRWEHRRFHQSKLEELEALRQEING